MVVDKYHYIEVFYSLKQAKKFSGSGSFIIKINGELLEGDDDHHSRDGEGELL